jgi:peptidyl-tRNA hydrolase ICT1
VNKLSTKATIRLPLSRASAAIPPYALSNLRSSPHFVASPPALLLSASAHRTQPQNLQECLVKLKSAILAAAREGLVGETSGDQKKRVSELVRRDKKRTETVKKQRKDVKSGRRTGKGGWD